jgi:hypothetical protein
MFQIDWECIFWQGSTLGPVCSIWCIDSRFTFASEKNCLSINSIKLCAPEILDIGHLYSWIKMLTWRPLLQYQWHSRGYPFVTRTSKIGFVASKMKTWVIISEIPYSQASEHYSQYLISWWFGSPRKLYREMHFLLPFNAFYGHDLDLLSRVGPIWQIDWEDFLELHEEGCIHKVGLPSAGFFSSLITVIHVTVLFLKTLWCLLSSMESLAHFTF